MPETTKIDSIIELESYSLAINTANFAHLLKRQILMQE